MSIVGHTSVEGFFHEVLGEALSQTGISVSPSTEFYLVGLLGEFASARIPDTPLALRLVQSEGGERVTALKEIGDTSLYVSGFFAESLSRQLVDVDYYIGMGGTAYRELSQRLAQSGVAQVYSELSAGFPAFVDVLARVRSQVNFAGDDVVTLYQEWLRTKSDWIEEKLRKSGVLVEGQGGEGYVQ